MWVVTVLGRLLHSATSNPEITLPFGWNLFATTAMVIVLVLVVGGVVWTLLDKRPVSVPRKIVWSVVQIVLPIIGLILWLLVESPLKNRDVSEP